MCGRYSFAPKPKQLTPLDNIVTLPSVLELRFNIAPTQEAYVIANDLPTILQKMEWGLVPYWSQDGKNSGKLINARAEGIVEKPYFRLPIQSKRCLVPADSFYEWRKLSATRKIPCRIFLENGELLYLAGIWDERKQSGKIKLTFSIITTTPNREMSELHDRMPVILPDAEAQQLWLSPLPFQELLSLLHPPKDDLLSMYRVSEKLNKAGYEGADLHTPVAEDLTLF